MDFIIEIRDLSISFPGEDRLLTAVDHVDLSVIRGETLVIIGESGSGKSVLGLAILSLLPDSVTVTGSVLFYGRDLLAAPESEIQKMRGENLGWIPQNPTLAFNPSMKIGNQIAECRIIHMNEDWSSARKEAVRLLETFHVLPALRRADEYPVSYSGGMLQRAMIAMGTAANPEVIIADEPTKGIDVMNKLSTITLFREMKTKGITQIIITHDLDLAAILADRVAVMYCGQILEITDAEQFFRAPYHPYSEALLRSLPRNGLHPIPGSAPPMNNYPGGCRFRDRCVYCRDDCSQEIPLKPGVNTNVRCLNHHIRNPAN